MTEDQKQEWKDKIDAMRQIEMASLRRFAPAGHPVFDRRNGLCEYFEERFQMLGGMTPAVSKAIG